MNPTEKPLTGAESLHLIQQMIQAARQDLSDNSFDLLLWGWAVAGAALGSYFLGRLQPEWAGWPWAVLLPLAAVTSVAYHIRQQRQQRAVTHLDHFMRYLWTGVGILFGFAFCLMVVFGYQPGYVLFMALCGLGTFATGGALGFRPLLWGGVGAWALAGTAFWVRGPELMLLMVLALLVSYIIPGHLLKAQYRRAHTI